MSIRLKLTIILFAFAVIPLIVISAITFNDYKNSLEKNHISDLENIIAFKAEIIEEYFIDLKTNIEVAQSFYNIKKNLPIISGLTGKTDDPEFIAAKEMLDGQLRQMQSTLDLFDIMLVDAEGRIVYMSNPAHFPKEFLKALPDPKQKAFVEGKSRIYFSDIFLDELADNRPEMLVSGPILDFNGDFIGVVAFQIDMKYFYKIIQDVTGLGETGEVSIGKKIGNDAVFLNPLRHAPEAVLMKSVSLGGHLGEPVQEAVSGRKGASQLIDYRGKKVIAAWRYIPSLDWGIVAKIDTEEVFADIMKLRNIMAIVLMIVLFLGGMAAFSIARSISEPIKQFARGAAIIGGGNLDYKVGTRQKDEIGQLSRAFDEMAQNLKSASIMQKKAQIELDNAKRLSDIGTLAATVAHELRNPLAAIGMAASNIRRKADNPLLDKNLDNIEKKITESDQIINNLLYYSRIRPPQYENINIYGILEECIDVTQNRPAKKILITKKLDSLKDVSIKADPTQIKEVFHNILNNAYDAVANAEGSIEINAKYDDGSVEISIKDNGVGIEKEYLDKIFQPFYTTKAKGTGLGLSVCSQIVSLHNGTINIESRRNKGTTVTVTLPKQNI